MAEQMELFGDEFARESYPTSFLHPDPSAPHLARIEIKAFKGIEELSIDLPRIAVLTGPNNSGKSTVLQAIIAGFECFRLCLDTDNWRFLEQGRAIRELAFLPVNEPRDMWFQRTTRRGQTWVPIVLSLTFTNGFACTFAIRSLYGFLNIRAADWTKDAGPEVVEQIASTIPVLITGVSGLNPHEPAYTRAHVHRLAGTGQPWAVLRNVLLDIQGSQAQDGLEFLRNAIWQHFGVTLSQIEFDATRDLEIRAPYVEGEYALDIVSAGSGMNQMLQLLSLVVWRGSRIVLIDEPDAHLHTSLQANLYDFLHDLSHQLNLQIILATHSRDLISRAPIETIIPVDLGQRELSPIGSIDHLLLEYRRHGAVSNVDLALLYQSKRCLFVEGPSDARYLPLFARQRGSDCFVGQRQVVVFEFMGADKFTMVSDLVSLFEDMIGQNITWMVIRDRHYAIPQVLEAYHAQAQSKGIKNYHIWQRFSIENYLLDPTILSQAIEKKMEERGEQSPSRQAIEELLVEASKQVIDQAQALYVTESQNAYMRFELSEENRREHGTTEALRFCREQMTGLAGYLQYLPGDALFGKFVELLQKTTGVNIRPEDVINAMNAESVPAEIRDVLEHIASL